MSLNLESIKDQFKDSISNYICPRQLGHNYDINLYSNGTISQPFYSFSQTISGFQVYANSITGTPGPTTVKLYSGANVLKSSTVSLSVGWNSISVGLGDLVSIRECSITVSGGVNVSNNYILGGSSNSTYFYSTASTILAFSVGVRDMVFKIFPIKELDDDDLPLVAVDVVGRPSYRDKYLSGDYIWEYITVRAEAFSKYTNELDKLIQGMDRGVMKNRRDFTDSRNISPGNISELTYLRGNLFTRSVTWQMMKLVPNF